jgi:hypothetical protein
MKRLKLWQGLPVLVLPFLISGCFYSYTINNFGPDGGAASSGTSTGGSGGNGSTGGRSTTGGSTGGSTGRSSTGGTSSSAGSSGGSGLCAPPDAGWPLNCGSVYSTLNGGTPIGDLAITPIDGGFLIGIVAAIDTSDYGGTYEALIFSPDGGWNVVGVDTGVDAVASTLSLAPPAGANPATVLAGGCDATSGACTFNQMYCAAPYSSDGGAPFEYVYDTSGDYAEVDKVRLARGPDGTLGFVVVDDADGVAGWGIGPAGGGCPTSATAIPTGLSVGIEGDSTPNDSAIAPMGPGNFAIAEAFTNTQGNDVLALFSEPSGSLIAEAPRFGDAFNPQVALATDGTNLTVLASDSDAGVLLYAMDAGALQNVATLSTAAGRWLTATSCGTDCTLAGWIEEAPGANGNSYTPKYAVVNGQGCGMVQAFLPALIGQDPAPDAVAFFPENGTAIFAYILNSSSTTTQLFLTVCTP